MKNVYKVMLLFLFLAQVAFGQKIEGTVYDAANSEVLAGVNVYFKDKAGMQGVVTDINGHYELSVPDGSVLLSFSYLGYETETQPLVLKRGGVHKLNVYLKIQSNLMNEVVVSVGRYEQKLSDITVSMELLKAADIKKQAPTDLTAVLHTLPGVDVTDRQPSIRSGSGWTYGVGSRCLILVDGQSVLTPGSGEINWNVVPMENIDQVEVLKGASSVLYGSSALNGLINVRTKRPSLDPVTNFNAYVGIYGNPKKEGYQWWDRSFWKDGKAPAKAFLRNNVFSGVRNPMYNGFDFSHIRRIGNWDVSGGLNLFTDEGYRTNNYTKRLRVGGNVTYHDPNIKNLNYGFNVNFLSNDYAGLFMWRSPEEAYQQSPLANMSRQANTFYIDPFLNYTNPDKHTTHRFRSRIYRQSNQIVSNPTDKSILDIADNMGFDYGDVPEIINRAQNWKAELLPLALGHLGEIMNGDVTGLVGEVQKLGNRYFPTATSADYMDMISWVTGHTPLPTNTSDLVPWISNALLGTGAVKPEPPIDYTTSYFMDYQFSKKYDHSQFTAGATYERVHADSKVTGIHNSDNAALFFQYDHKLFDRLNVSAGVRFEYYRVDENYKESETKILGVDMPVKPVFRGGLNYELGEYSFIRASFGQGYRYPSVIEKFVLKDIGGMGAFPNANLKAEQGYNAELGFKQGYKWGNLTGFADVAAFYTRYKDMIEFQFGLFDKTSFEYIDGLGKLVNVITNKGGIGIGAQFTNMGRAEIYGVDLSTSGAYTFNANARLTYNVGYVYTEPIDMDADERNEKEETNKDLMAMKSKSNNSKYLKYRQKHTVKSVLDFEWKRLSIGTNVAWKSKSLAVDYFMVDEREKMRLDLMDYMRSMLFGNLHDYWADNNNGYFTMDVRLGVKVTKNIRFQGMINNVLNTEYSSRPMDVAAPRTFILQLGASF